MSVTLLDIAKLKHGDDGVLHIIDAVGKSAPEVMAIPARTIKGTQYDVTLVTAFPRPGFRAANKGAVKGKASFETRKAQCYILDQRIEVDRAVAKAHSEGPDALLALYTKLAGKGSILSIGEQTFYGTATDGKGFPGLSEMASADMMLNAGGSTADGTTSVYFVHAGEMGVEYIFGDEQVFDLSPFENGDGEDADGKKFPAHIAYLNSRPGLSCASPFSVGRIANLSKQAGKGLTDDLLSEMLEKFPMDTQPTHIFMNRQSRGQLQRDRSVVLQGNGKKGSVGGGSSKAPLPTEFEGIPIITTDSLVNTEAVTAFA